MKKCKKCEKPFPSSKVIDGREHNFANRKYCFDCSPFKQHNTIPLEKYADASVGICSKCNKSFSYSRKAGHRRKTCNNCLVNHRRPTRKTEAIAYKGGKCLVCKYSACESALGFHHLDPDTKKISIAHAYLLSKDQFFAELDKCVLVCCRCHAEVHAGMIAIVTIAQLEVNRLKESLASPIAQRPRALA